VKNIEGLSLKHKRIIKSETTNSSGTILSNKHSTMKQAIIDLNNQRVKLEQDYQERTIALHKLSLKKNDEPNDRERMMIQRSAMKLMEDYNKKNNISSFDKQNKIVNKDNDSTDHEMDKKKASKKKSSQGKKKSKIAEILEDNDEISVAFTNFTNETEYTIPQDKPIVHVKEKVNMIISVLKKNERNDDGTYSVKNR
jgi:hypothetical protein